MTTVFHLRHRWSRFGKRPAQVRRWLNFNLVGGLGITFASGVSIILCSILNFLASDHLVFPHGHHA